MSNEGEVSINDTVDNVMAKLEADGALDEGESAKKQKQPADEIKQDEPAEAEAVEQPIGEDEETKTSEKEESEPPKAAIEPPASWPSTERESFQQLPEWAQELISRRDREMQADYTLKTQTAAQERRAAEEERRLSHETRAKYAGELERLADMAAQLLPAKFSDIKSESDYLRLKATDPGRASEYEAFQMALRSAMTQQQQVKSQQYQEHLNREWQTLQEKDPVFKDATKAKEIMEGVRKTAVDYYGFQPNEVEVIADHRYVPIIRDAMAWRQHQVNLRAAEAKKTAPAPQRVLKQTASSNASISDDRKNALLNRARKTENVREKADYLARILEG